MRCRLGLERSLRSSAVGATLAAAADVGGVGRAETNEAAVGVKGEAREHGHVKGGEHGRSAVCATISVKHLCGFDS